MSRAEKKVLSDRFLFPLVSSSLLLKDEDEGERGETDEEESREACRRKDVDVVFSPRNQKLTLTLFLLR